MKVIKVNDEVFWLVMGWNKTGQECMQDQNLLRIGNEKRFQLRERKKKRKRKNKRRSEDELSGEQGVDDVVKMVSLSGAEIDLPRIKLNSDEQMCWYICNKFCRIVGFSGR